MREMKDSGIEWIGEIPKEWGVTRHKYVMHKDKAICDHYDGQDIISLTMNGVVVRDLDAGGKMPTSFDGYQYVEPDDLLLCLFDIDVTPRCVGLVKNSGVTSPAYSRFKVHDGYFGAYYDYLLRFIDNEKVFVHLSKNLRSSLTESDFGSLPTIVPTLKEQKRIVYFLEQQCTEIDNILTKTRDSIEEYKKLKQAVITQAITKGVRGDREMKDSGIEWIGKIPEDWGVIKMKNIGKCRNGLTYSPDNIVSKEEGTLVLRSSNIKAGKLSFVDNVYVNSEIKDDLMVKTGDILICSRNGSRALIGKNALIPEDLNASFGAFMMIFRCQAPKYVQMILNSAVFSYYLGTFLTSTINQLTADNFNNMKIVYCSDKFEQKEITDYLDKKCAEIDTLITKKEQIIVELENYKKSVIYEYVTGKREVPETWV